MEKKLKSLLPSLKEKKRYIVYEQVSGKLTQKQLTKKIEQYLGVFESANAGIQPILQNNKGKGIIRVSNKYVDKTIASMMLQSETMIIPLKTTGVLNKAKKVITG